MSESEFDYIVVGAGSAGCVLASRLTGRRRPAHPQSASAGNRGRDPLAVVDRELRVYGIERLRVVDASIMPRITSGNTNAATIMIGEKASDLILGKAPPPAWSGSAGRSSRTESTAVEA